MQPCSCCLAVALLTENASMQTSVIVGLLMQGELTVHDHAHHFLGQAIG